ncbi:MAG: RHS repeat-associated core domain-containing protein [Chloroflexota bacterium]
MTDTYAYVGSSEVIAKITPSTGASTSSIVDPTGARTAVSTSSGGFGWTLSDLHGNSAGYATLGGGVISDARRYDPYGETLASVSSGLARPWGYQGRLLLSASGDAELYDFVFRAYVPDLGAFSSPDDLAGSALDPITFNRYLYAGANPATLVDPDGHCYLGDWWCATLANLPGGAALVPYVPDDAPHQAASAIAPYSYSAAVGIGVADSLGQTATDSAVGLAILARDSALPWTPAARARQADGALTAILAGR